MSFLLNILLAPVMGPMKGVLWLAETINDQVEAEKFDGDKVRAELSELELRLDLGQIELEDYEKQEDALLRRLKEIREAKQDDPA